MKLTDSAWIIFVLTGSQTTHGGCSEKKIVGITLLWQSGMNPKFMLMVRIDGAKRGSLTFQLDLVSCIPGDSKRFHCQKDRADLENLKSFFKQQKKRRMPSPEAPRNPIRENSKPQPESKPERPPSPVPAPREPTSPVPVNTSPLPTEGDIYADDRISLSMRPPMPPPRPDLLPKPVIDQACRGPEHPTSASEPHDSTSSDSPDENLDADKIPLFGTTMPFRLPQRSPARALKPAKKPESPVRRKPPASLPGDGATSAADASVENLPLPPPCPGVSDSQRLQRDPLGIYTNGVLDRYKPQKLRDKKGYVFDFNKVAMNLPKRLVEDVTFFNKRTSMIKKVTEINRQVQSQVDVPRENDLTR